MKKEKTKTLKQIGVVYIVAPNNPIVTYEGNKIGGYEGVNYLPATSGIDDVLYLANAKYNAKKVWWWEKGQYQEKTII